jgi:hypothetical protein
MYPIIPGAGPYVTPSGQSVNPNTVRFVQEGVEGGTGFGNAGRNILTGPDTVNLDLSLSKRVRFYETVQAELRIEVFDLLNRENPGPFGGNPFIAASQQVSSTIFRAPSSPILAQSLASPSLNSLASVTGATPENAIDANASYVGLKEQPFLSQKFLTTSSRRVQFSVRLSF